ncbi:hypothetical protein B0J12DRAFT_788627 [Macrophomina phaseolina]|uniref:Uncharacterized protein n=1 Tax=Macrophomina phaseolina TaxID=35725 RepID=A0ABQ8G2M8_9PEZI|nr:hypothetical protein B0J12DRAFT_788627 [Macrophomina phaseolina]
MATRRNEALPPTHPPAYSDPPHTAPQQRAAPSLGTTVTPHAKPMNPDGEAAPITPLPDGVWADLPADWTSEYAYNRWLQSNKELCIYCRCPHAPPHAYVPDPEAEARYYAQLDRLHKLEAGGHEDMTRNGSSTTRNHAAATSQHTALSDPFIHNQTITSYGAAAHNLPVVSTDKESGKGDITARNQTDDAVWCAQPLKREESTTATGQRQYEDSGRKMRQHGQIGKTPTQPATPPRKRGDSGCRTCGRNHPSPCFWEVGTACHLCRRFHLPGDQPCSSRVGPEERARDKQRVALAQSLQKAKNEEERDLARRLIRDFLLGGRRSHRARSRSPADARDTYYRQRW